MGDISDEFMYGCLATIMLATGALGYCAGYKATNYYHKHDLEKLAPVEYRLTEQEMQLLVERARGTTNTFEAILRDVK